MKETITVNNIRFTLGHKYLHKIVNPYQQNENKERCALKPNDYANVKEIFENTDLQDAEKWQEVAKIANLYD